MATRERQAPSSFRRGDRLIIKKSFETRDDGRGGPRNLTKDEIGTVFMFYPPDYEGDAELCFRRDRDGAHIKIFNKDFHKLACLEEDGRGLVVSCLKCLVVSLCRPRERTRSKRTRA